jgi:hypothetical protein
MLNDAVVNDWLKSAAIMADWLDEIEEQKKKKERERQEYDERQQRLKPAVNSFVALIFY